MVLAVLDGGEWVGEGGGGRSANLLFQLQVFGLEGDLSGEMSV